MTDILYDTAPNIVLWGKIYREKCPGGLLKSHTTTEQANFWLSFFPLTALSFLQHQCLERAPDDINSELGGTSVLWNGNVFI